MAVGRLLTIKTGSSSLKADLYRLREDATESPELRAEASRIEGRGGGLRLADGRGETLDERRDDLAAVGRRIVRRGDRHRESRRVPIGVTADLRASVPVAPDHLPRAIAAIEAAGRAYAVAPQVACFRAAFHSRMPKDLRMAGMYGGRRGRWPPVLSPNSEPCWGSGV